MIFPDFKNELEAIKKGFLVAGCDEVGRGPVAGPVVASACILNHKGITEERENKWYERIRDSKTIPEDERELLLEKIIPNCLAFGIGLVSEQEIDEINIHNASLLAMRRAVEDILKKVDNKKSLVILIDGRFTIPGLNTYSNTYSKIEQKSIIKGDGSVLSIAAASIIAKVHRDNIMKNLHKKFPEYGFDRHKGYGTKGHQEAIKKFGPSAVHRKSFLKDRAVV